MYYAVIAFAVVIVALLCYCSFEESRIQCDHFTYMMMTTMILYCRAESLSVRVLDEEEEKLCDIYKICIQNAKKKK